MYRCWHRFWSKKCLKNHQKIDQKSIKKRHRIQDRFRYRFLIDFWSILAPKILQTPRQGTNAPQRTFLALVPCRGPDGQKMSSHRFGLNLKPIIDFWIDFPSKMDPKIDPKSIQNLIKNRLRINIDFQVDFSSNFDQIFLDV